MYTATSGVPRGSHLSPLLFFLLINSVSSVLSYAEILCFADDIKLYARITNLDDCRKLRLDYDHFTHWFSLLGLSLDVFKYKTMTFTRLRSQLVFSSYLGVTSFLHSDSSVVDLGFMLKSSSLDPGPHIG